MKTDIPPTGIIVTDHTDEELLNMNGGKELLEIKKWCLIIDKIRKGIPITEKEFVDYEKYVKILYLEKGSEGKTISVKEEIKEIMNRATNLVIMMYDFEHHKEESKGDSA